MILVNLIPYTWLHSFAGLLVRILLPFFPGARKRVEENILHFKPDLHPDERRKFVIRNLTHTLRVTLEVFQTGKFRSKKFLDRYIEIADSYSIDVLKNRSQGVIAIEGHFGNWELPILYYHHYGVDIAYSAKHLKNPLVDRTLEKKRQGYGGKLVYLSQSSRFIKELKRGNVVGLVADQDAGRNGIFVDFLGRPASTYTGPAVLSYLAQADIVLATCLYQGKGRYRLQLKPVHSGSDNSQYAHEEEAHLKITQRWSQVLANEIEKVPEQYFWVHRRWKTKKR